MQRIYPRDLSCNPLKERAGEMTERTSTLKLDLVILLLSFLIALTISYLAIYITDEWISADQVNHLVEGDDLLYGYYPYGSAAYAASHHDCLCYTLALPALSLPAYYLFSLFDDSFRLFVIVLWSALLLAVILMIEWWFPRYARWHVIPWTYAAIISWGILFVLNMALYRPFWFVRGVHPADVSVYPEVAAIVFTNTVAFALFALVVYHLFLEIFGSVRWGIFGLVATLTSSSYLFWSGNAKDHMLVMLFFTIAVYCFVLYLSTDHPLPLFSAFIAVGWTAWARPELGPSLLVGFTLSALILSARKGWRESGKIVLATSGVALGALPLFVNNLGLTGHPLLLPWVAGYGAAAPSGLPTAAGTLGATVARHYAPPTGDLLSGFYGTFFDPSYSGSAGIFQVSPFSFFALLLLVPVGYQLYTSGRSSLSSFSTRDCRLIAFFALTVLIVLAAYLKSIPWMGGSQGIVPDMRYLTPIYLPMIVLGTYALRYVGYGEDEIIRSLKTLFWLIVIDLPLIYLVLQLLSGREVSGQVAFLMPLTYLFLAAAALLYLLAAAGKTRPMTLATFLPVLMLFSLAWEAVVDFRFATLCWEGYHFWIPLVQYIWYIQYAVFPL